MKIAILASVVSLLGTANAFFARGPCPNSFSLQNMSVPFDASMVTGNNLYFTMADTLLYNGLTLYQLFGNSTYQTPYCEIEGPQTANFNQ